MLLKILKWLKQWESLLILLFCLLTEISLKKQFQNCFQNFTAVCREHYHTQICGYSSKATGAGQEATSLLCLQNIKKSIHWKANNWDLSYFASKILNLHGLSVEINIYLLLYLWNFMSFWSEIAIYG